MKESSREFIEQALQAQRNYFSTQVTKNIDFRLRQLKKFKSIIKKYENEIAEALWIDLHKSYEESYLTEISIVVQELDNHIKHLKKWAKPVKKQTPIHLLPSSSKIIYEPLGLSLIIAPWNYPFQLLMNALVGAISSGCCALLKPSPYTPNIALLMEKMIHEAFDSNYIVITQGGRTVNEILFEQRFDIIFFTGSPMLGKIVMQAASKHLCPVVLELGGKSPCIVDEGADIEIAAKRIVWGKLINAGQTCIAPDYLFVHESVKEKLIEQMKHQIENMYGTDIKSSRFYPRIVNDDAFERLMGLMKHGEIIYGGNNVKAERFIAPTLIDKVEPDFPIMQEEIFGPLLPILNFKDIEEVISYVNENEKPLAFYYFGQKKKANTILRLTSSGGACINDTLMHITNHRLPFGGVGNSGLGKYHGKDSFLAFSNARGTVRTPTWIDLPLKYVPFKHFRLIKKII